MYILKCRVIHLEQIALNETQRSFGVNYSLNPLSSLVSRGAREGN